MVSVGDYRAKQLDIAVRSRMEPAQLSELLTDDKQTRVHVLGRDGLALELEGLRDCCQLPIDLQLAVR